MLLRRVSLVLLSLIGFLFVTQSANANSGGSVQRKYMTINWWDGKSKGKEHKKFEIPGVGVGQLTCSKSSVQVEVYPDDTDASTSIWSVVYHKRNGKLVPSVRTARTPFGSLTNPGVATESTAEVLSGSRISDSGQGNMIAIITQRNQEGQISAPTTQLSLEFQWRHMRRQTSRAKCYMAAQAITVHSENVYINHLNRFKASRGAFFGLLDGYAGSTLGSQQTLANVPGIGELKATCSETNIGFHLRADRPSWMSKVEVTEYMGTNRFPKFKRYLVNRKRGTTSTIFTPENGIVMAKIYPTMNSRQPSAVLLMSSQWDYENGSPICELNGQVLYGGW